MKEEKIEEEEQEKVIEEKEIHQSNEEGRFYYYDDNDEIVECTETGELTIGKMFILKVTLGWEHKVMNEISTRLVASDCVKDFKDNIYAIIAAGMPGYIIVEARSLYDVNKLIGNQRISAAYSRIKGAGRVLGEVNIDDISEYLTPKKSTERFSISDTVEIYDGAFRGERARVVDVIHSTEELKVELFGQVPISLTLPADKCKVLESIG